VFLFRAFGIGIVNTQDEFATSLAGDQEIHQGGAQVADMDISCGRRGKTCRDHERPPLGLDLPFPTKRAYCPESRPRRMRILRFFPISGPLSGPVASPDSGPSPRASPPTHRGARGAAWTTAADNS